jgi:hypothetical protein
MSDAPDPDNEKLLRELDAQTTSLKDYLAAHPGKEREPRDLPTRRISPVLVGIVHFITSAALCLFSVAASIGRATGGNGLSESTISLLNVLLSVLCPTLPLARFFAGRDLSFGEALLLIFVSSVIYSIAFSRLFLHSERQKPNGRNA